MEKASEFSSIRQKTRKIQKNMLNTPIRQEKQGLPHLVYHRLGLMAAKNLFQLQEQNIKDTLLLISPTQIKSGETAQRIIAAGAQASYNPWVHWACPRPLQHFRSTQIRPMIPLHLFFPKHTAQQVYLNSPKGLALFWRTAGSP